MFAKIPISIEIYNVTNFDTKIEHIDKQYSIGLYSNRLLSSNLFNVVVNVLPIKLYHSLL